MRSGAAMSRRISATALVCESVRRVGEGGDECVRRRVAVAGRAGARLPLHARAHQRQARAGWREARHRRGADARRRCRDRCRPALSGCMERARASPRKPASRGAAASVSSCHSGRSGRSLERGADGAAKYLARQPGGQRIDGLDQRQLGELFRADDMVGMDDLRRRPGYHSTAPDTKRVSPSGSSRCR